jgi:hypothetical protein
MLGGPIGLVFGSNAAAVLAWMYAAFLRVQVRYLEHGCVLVREARKKDALVLRMTCVGSVPALASIRECRLNVTGGQGYIIDV